MALDALWSESFPTRPRPETYSSQEIAGDGYLPLTDTSDFLVDGLHSLSASQLYALTANNAEALRQAQEEWTSLERLANQLKTQDRFSTIYKDPQALPSAELFEERKEATLYNYKYEANRPMLQSKFTIPTGPTDQEKFDLREPPNPFAQRIPNDKQYRGIMAAARSEGREKNPDNQTPYEENFAFRSRPQGTWIAKMAPTEAVQPPRTRAREAQLNGSLAERQTRFNGEKVPVTRGVGSADEMQSRVATPIGSPASRKRKIETVDVVLPRKKHPNQHTKRREREEAERLAALGQQNAIVASQTDSGASPVPTPKKKHPNQYTKRREREEAERLLREQQEQELREMTDYLDLSGNQATTMHQMENQSYLDQPYALPKKKHPNQYTKRREQEEAERIGEADGYYQDHSSRIRRQRSFQQTDKATESFDVAPRQSTPMSPRPQLANHPSRNIDFSRMSTAELRTFTFKDWELTTLLRDRYLWLNDDPALAKQWKIKIENSAYAMRTYAMLKKWKEWASEGRDKRPRDKDKTKSRGKNESNTKIDGEEADVESMADDPIDNAADSTYIDTNGRSPSSRIITLKRPVRTRSSRLPFDGGESPKVMPSSPLVNGVNARDLDRFDKGRDQARVQSFTSTLRTMGEFDNATKVDRWQADPTVDDSKTSTTLPAPARLISHGTEDDMYPSTQSTLQPDDNSTSQRDTKMDVDSEVPSLHRNHYSHNSFHQYSGNRMSWAYSTQDSKSNLQNSLNHMTANMDGSTDTDLDTITVNGPSLIKQEDLIAPNSTALSGRSQRSARSNNAMTASASASTSVSPNKRPRQTATQPRLTRGTSNMTVDSGMSASATVTVAANPILTTPLIRPSYHDHDSSPTPTPSATPTPTQSTSDGDGAYGSPNLSPTLGMNGTTTSINTTGGGPTRRAGLRPNPVKRTLTADSLKSAEGSVNGPIRRSMRGATGGV